MLDTVAYLLIARERGGSHHCPQDTGRQIKHKALGQSYRGSAPSLEATGPILTVVAEVVGQLLLRAVSRTVAPHR
jgi:hypothetical protein